MKIFKNILLFLLMLTSTGILAQQDTLKLQREARALLRDGNDLYNKQKYVDASVAYKKALGKNSKYQKGNYNLGNALYQEKNYKEAVPQYELTAKTAKDKFAKAEAYHNIGNAMMEQKQYQPAVDAYKNSLRNNPKDDETRYNLAVAQQLLDKENKDKKDDKNKDKNKDKKDDKKKDDKNKDKDKDKKDGDDKDKKKDDKDGKGDDKQDKNKDKKKQEPKPQQGKMTPQQMKQLLESLNNEEKKTQKKMNAKKAKGKKVKQEKDW
ncbi:tetratricopeptide repeat protein [Tenacibaculum aquimarinum]|uniref:tetratricopeptide repeat protein n=1 Tax=Tenacibaculum aquimarinum TaxID=2910675 RepID=UPI001F0ABCA5|nr:tetratricopeptide repeat protein [Tenacibaculum aquimarinum]MCH3881613.1 tetratricopeptide repeat protein [Tenacibaculum aquimarinum]